MSRDTSAAEAKGKVFYEDMVRRVDRQFASVDSLDTKIAAWFQSSGLVVTILVGILVAEKANLNTFIGAAAALGFLFYLFGLVALYLAHRPVSLWPGLTWQSFATLVKNQGLGIDAFFYGLAFKLGEVEIVENEKLLKDKARLLNCAAFLFFLATLTLVVAALLGLRTMHPTANPPPVLVSSSVNR